MSKNYVKKPGSNNNGNKKKEEARNMESDSEEDVDKQFEILDIAMGGAEEVRVLMSNNDLINTDTHPKCLATLNPTVKNKVPFKVGTVFKQKNSRTNVSNKKQRLLNKQQCLVQTPLSRSLGRLTTLLNWT